MGSQVHALGGPPDACVVFFDIANLSIEAGLFDAVLPHFKTCTELNAGYIDAYVTASQFLSTLNRDQEALSWLDGGRDLFLRNLEWAQASQDPLKQADAARKVSLLHQAYSNVYTHMVEYEQATQHLNEAIKLSPDNMQSWVLLALVERKKGRQDNCMLICDKILSMDPNNENAYPDQ